MPKPKNRIYDRNLRKMFWPGDREFNARVARLCVLYEDLRIEYHGSRMLKPIRQLDRLSKMYRQFYFLRRSLVTLIEFQGALSQINRGRWKHWIEQHQDPVMRKSWAMSIRYFNENSKRWEALRGDVGGHYPEAAAKFAVDRLTSNATGSIEATEIGDSIGDFKLHFCTELIAVALRKAMDNHQPSEDEFRQFIAEMLQVITKGWEHAVGAVQVILVGFLVPKFMAEEVRQK